MITEYCSHGDLLNFLRAQAQSYMVSILSVDDVAFYRNSRLRRSGVFSATRQQTQAETADVRVSLQ